MTAPLSGQLVLAVFAHPDDESLACGGTIARLAHLGATVVVMVASHGERGGPEGPVRNDELGRQRAQEMRRAAAALGVSRLFVWDHPDGEMRWSRVADFHGDLVLFMRRYAPSAVITFGEDGLYWHFDHVGVYERTTTAVRALGSASPPLYYVTMKRGVIPDVVAAARASGWTPPPKGFWSVTPEAYGLAAEAPTIALDVSAFVPQKLAAIECHISQMGSHHPFAQVAPAEARRLLGVEDFHRSAIVTTRPLLLEALCTSTS